MEKLIYFLFGFFVVGSIGGIMAFSVGSAVHFLIPDVYPMGAAIGTGIGTGIAIGLYGAIMAAIHI